LKYSPVVRHSEFEVARFKKLKNRTIQQKTLFMKQRSNFTPKNFISEVSLQNKFIADSRNLNFTIFIQI